MSALLASSTAYSTRNFFSTRPRTIVHVDRRLDPDVDQTCAYCESRIFDHDPICVRDCTDNCGSPTYFCNYACLWAYVEKNGLTADDACEWSPE